MKVRKQRVSQKEGALGTKVKLNNRMLVSSYLISPLLPQKEDALGTKVKLNNRMLVSSYLVSPLLPSGTLFSRRNLEFFILTYLKKIINSLTKCC
ncbi:hypothetical protein KJA13_00965 [Patescibacteria group bacterium]|nr:hypothetical protein [Patescibacteria group bacterium]